MAGYTLSEKIFSRASKKEVRAGEFIMADIDRAMVHDITGPLAVKGFYEIAGEDATVWDPSKIVILFDHQVPADSLAAPKTTSCSESSPSSRESSTTMSSRGSATR